MNHEERQELELLLKQMRDVSAKIRENNFTKKTKGTNYPINVGYATAVRRPFRDLLRWMKGVEHILETIIEEEATV